MKHYGNSVIIFLTATLEETQRTCALLSPTRCTEDLGSGRFLLRFPLHFTFKTAR